MPPVAVHVTVGAGGEARLTKPEAGVSDQEKIDQTAIDGVAARRGQLRGGRLIQVKFDDRARDVPCGILAAYQVVGLMMIDRIGLQQAPVRAP